MSTAHQNGTGEPATTTGSEGIDLMGLLAFVARMKELLLATFVTSLLLTYGAIYVFIDEQFEATAVIVPNEDMSLSGLGDVVRGMKSLPFGLGSQSIGSETDLYKTIIMMAAGIIDPLKVTRSALQNAASVAAMVLTTEAAVTDLPEKKDAMPPMPSGMGGMDGMM